jgi:glycosyltransferase involved in cell wall biosynthesis
MQWLLLILLIPYLYLFLKISRNLFKIRPYTVHDLPSVFVSVIIPCLDEEKNLYSVLSDISAQDYSPELYELIIVDDNSSDMTFSVASGFRGIRNLRVYKNLGRGKKQAIRTGVALSTGSLVITSDADCRMGKSWIRTVASSYEKKRPDLIICPVVLKGMRGFFHRFQELEFLGLQGVTAGCAVAGNPVMCNGANLAFNKGSYTRHSEDLHDELISGDDVFLLHCIKKDHPDKILWLESENAIVATLTSATIGSFIRQRARWISKAGSYTDSGTKVIAIVTLITILLQVSLLIAGIFDPIFLPVFLAVFLLKSIPDYMILKNTTARYGKKNLMRWFFFSQFIYPFYVVTVLFSCLLQPKAESPSSPYQRGT